MSIKVIRYRLPSYWACPLINDDYTGLTDEECEEIHKIQDMERLNFETLFRIVRWDYNRCFKDESLDKDLFVEKYGRVMGEHYYNKFVHEFDGNILKMVGYFRGILKIEDGLSAWENQIEKYRFATESERQKLVDALKASKEPEAKEYLKRFFGIEEKPKYDFKPFDKVLAKYYEDDNWEAGLFIRTITDDQDGETKYECLNGTVYVYCIPFEGNEYLLGTAENPEK